MILVLKIISLHRLLLCDDYGKSAEKTDDPRKPIALKNYPQKGYVKIIFRTKAHVDGVVIENLFFRKHTGIYSRHSVYIMSRKRLQSMIDDDWFAIHFFEAATGRCARECVSDCVKGYRMEGGRHA